MSKHGINVMYNVGRWCILWGLIMLAISAVAQEPGGAEPSPHPDDYLHAGEATRTKTAYGFIYTFQAPGRQPVELRCFHEPAPPTDQGLERYDETCYQKVDYYSRVVKESETDRTIGLVIRRGFFDLLRAGVDDLPLYEGDAP